MGELALLIPFAPFAMVAFIVWTKHQSRLQEMKLKMQAEQPAASSAHTRELEERVRVLERIITDKGYDVASQIEALRDARKTEALLDQSEKELRP